jgi:peptidoglycan/LPS O-acetylase OafA/YrhL
MPGRETMTRLLLVLYAIGSVAVAIPILLAIGHAGELANTTSGRVLAAALSAMALGAALAARDPWQHRLVILVLIVFTALSTVAIALRLAFGDYERDPAWLVLPLAVGAPVLLTVFYPRRPHG